jgi:hypothetical protein
MAAAQLLFNFTETHPIPVKTSYARIIQFPITPTAQAKQEKQTEQIIFAHGFTSFEPYGSWINYNKRLSTSERLRINKEAIALLSKPCEQLSPAELNTLRSYSGWGGLSASDERGVLYDYYTSPPIAFLVWKLLDRIQPILKNATVLEPSCGTGIFFATGSKDVSYTGIELDKRTAVIASCLHPQATILSQSYEAFNISGNSANKYDHIIGNIPFGERTLETAFMDMPDEKSLDRYFISRSLDNLKPCGTMALIVHSGILANKSNIDWRLSINRKARFVGAVKLNDRSFNHAHTTIQPDILFFEKHPQDIEQRLQTFSVCDMEKSSYAQENWINGTYFSSRHHHIMGEVQQGKGQWNSDVVSGTVTPEALELILSVFEPEPPIAEQEHDELRKAVSLVKQKVKTSILSLTSDEIKAVEGKTLPTGSVKTVDTAVYLLSDDYRWNLAADDKSLAERINRILPISKEIQSIRKKMRNGSNVVSIQEAVKSTLTAYKDCYGEYPKNDNLINRFLRNHPSVSGIYDALIDPASDILTIANLYDNNGNPVNGHNRAVEALLFLQQRMLPATAKTIRQYFSNEAKELTAEMYRNPDIFLSEQRTWQLREDFISGGAWNKIDALNALVTIEKDTAKQTKWRYGISELEKAVGWIPIEEADFSPHSSWIQEEIINAWVGDSDGLGRSDCMQYGKLSKNESGKWGIRYNGNHSFYDSSARNYRSVRAGQWEDYADEVVYYLNMQKQRSRYNDTETFNREHNDSFKSYIANHAAYRDELENKYNRIFNTEMGVPVKTYPVYIEGWLDNSKTLKPHQWQSVHHLYREGKGISALGTGFGKTLTGIALHALLKQEGRIKRAWFQVPNNKVKDWIEEIHEVLPSRTIGYVDPEMPGYSSREKRYALYQQLANSSYDIILMPESSAGEIQLSPEQDRVITNEVVSKHIGEKGGGKTERYIENLKESVSRKLENGKTNRTICFEDFGCDAIFVDEGHRYKNLFSSTLSRETGLNDGRQSAKAMALFKKSEYIRRTNNGKNVYLLTATPLTNSPLEYFNMLMYIAPEELERFGISTIDGFIKNFADIETGIAYDWQNGTVTEKKILKGFKNIQTLQNLFFKYTDYQNDPQKINLDKPDAHNRPNVIPSNSGQTGVLQAISAELEKYKAADKDERKDLFPGQNYLTFYSQMRTASLDLELHDPASWRNWQNPKLMTLANNARQNYLATKGGQVIFCDRVFSGDGSFNIHDKIKRALCDAGFKHSEITIVNGFTKSGGMKNDSVIEKEVSQAVNAFNKGIYKVIIGSTACIGEGLNLQENSAALHHFDIPFRPSDFIQRNGRIDRQGNTQDKVELHTYLSAGTIDNYSVSLVQRKANWIDQLLKTKSNVFLNPNDESYIDADELLLALTEEWGDAAKAEERRKELDKVKTDKMAEAQEKQRKDNLASLSLLRGALFSYNGDKGQLSYQNRLRKIAMLEKSLLNNSVFTKHELVKTSIPFLYSKDSDTVIRKGDMLIIRGKPYEVISLNFKRREFTSRPLWEKSDEKERDHVMSVNDLTDDDTFIYLSQPSREERKFITLIHTNEFYRHSSRELQERFYPTHLKCAVYNDYHPPFFTAGEEDRLAVNEVRHWNYSYKGSEKAYNPFLVSDMAVIKKLARNGIEVDHKYKLEEYSALFCDCIPELAFLLYEAMPQDEEIYAKSA